MCEERVRKQFGAASTLGVIVYTFQLALSDKYRTGIQMVFVAVAGIFSRMPFSMLHDLFHKNVCSQPLQSGSCIRTKETKGRGERDKMRCLFA